MQCRLISARKSIFSSMGNLEGKGRSSGEVLTHTHTHLLAVAIVTLSNQLKDLNHGSRFPAVVYLTYAHLCTLPHLVPRSVSQCSPVNIQVIHKEIRSSGALMQTAECDSVLFGMMGWQLAT